MLSKSHGHLSASKSFQLPEGNQDVRKQIISFWSARGFTFAQAENEIITGARGSKWGNLFSFNMNNLVTNLTISIDASNCCTCTLDVNTSMQHITAWNEAHWLLELDTFESFILNGDMKEQEWTVFRASSTRKDICYVIVVMLVVFILSGACILLFSQINEISRILPLPHDFFI